MILQLTVFLSRKSELTKEGEIHFLIPLQQVNPLGLQNHHYVEFDIGQNSHKKGNANFLYCSTIISQSAFPSNLMIT